MNATMLLAIGTGGAIGSVCRYLLAGAIGNATGGAWPWGTLAVNVIGGFAIGALAEAFALRGGVPPELRGFLVTGILGGFTTFSAFSLETMALIERQAWGAALAYVAASVLASLLAAFAGAWCVRLAA
ncbi:MAG: fluoride efflux transporter CrcB [Alphaproteobacteria bacterium]